MIFCQMQGRLWLGWKKDCLGTMSTRVKGLPGNIDPSKPPKSFKDAVSREDRQQWAEAYDREFQGSLSIRLEH
jgi:hypothetical protein